MNKIKELAIKSGVCRATIYKRMKEILDKEGESRLPTLEELKERKRGRPKKYDY